MDYRDSRWIDPETGLRLLTLVDSVCRRPRWFTMNGAFAEAVAFLNGCYFSPGTGPEEKTRAAEWYGFVEWLTERLQVVHPVQTEGVRPAIYFFDRIRSECPDDETALARLADWWFEYWSSHHPKDGA
jgi:hypothetical protein